MQQQQYRIELGGGRSPAKKDKGFLNLDHLSGCAQVDIVCDLSAPNLRLPFEDQSVCEVYSSHTLEHVDCPVAVLREVCRVCSVGARAEIRVPHHLNSMAMCPGHRFVISEMVVRHWCVDFAEHTWRGCPRRLRLLDIERVPSEHFFRVRDLFGLHQADRQDVLRYAPDACHEVRFFFEVISNS
jgi:SAM-dependent methyltransferase